MKPRKLDEIWKAALECMGEIVEDGIRETKDKHPDLPEYYRGWVYGAEWAKKTFLLATPMDIVFGEFEMQNKIDKLYRFISENIKPYDYDGDNKFVIKCTLCGKRWHGDRPESLCHKKKCIYGQAVRFVEGNPKD